MGSQEKNLSRCCVPRDVLIVVADQMAKNSGTEIKLKVNKSGKFCSYPRVIRRRIIN